MTSNQAFYFTQVRSWRIIQVSKWLWDPFQMTFPWLINGGDPNYLLTGMILQVPSLIGYIFFYLKADDEMHASQDHTGPKVGFLIWGVPFFQKNILIR